MQLSFLAVILALSVGVFAQTSIILLAHAYWRVDVEDPVKQDANGNIIPALKEKRSGVQWEEYVKVKRQIDEAIPVKMDKNGNVPEIGWFWLQAIFSLLSVIWLISLLSVRLSR